MRQGISTSTFPWIARLRWGALALLALGATGSLGSAQSITRVSVTSRGIEGNGGSSAFTAGGLWGPALSPEGRWIAFESAASNLVPGDLNAARDVFLHDRWSGSTERVSVDSLAAEANGASGVPALSADGRFVAFESLATNLVAGDTNARRDVFVRDRQTGLTERVSVSTAGVQANNDCFLPSLSADGRYVAFTSIANSLVPGDAGGFRDVFIRDRQLGTTILASVSTAGVQGNANSIDPRLSADGRTLAFTSLSTNLVAGDVNGMRDIFARDLVLGVTQLISLDSAGLQADFESDHAAVNTDGRYVAFQSGATNLVPGDTNGSRDVFVRDRTLGTTVRVSVNSTGAQSNFFSYFPSISADGQRIAFDSNATGLVPGDSNGSRDVFLHDRSTGLTTRLSVDNAGLQGTGTSALPALSADGLFAVFEAVPAGFVHGDANGAADVFVRAVDLVTPPIAAYCTAKVNSQGCTPILGSSGAPHTSGPDAFRVVAVNVLPNVAGLLLWSQSSAATPFLGGTLCVGAPIKRLPGQSAVPEGLAQACLGTYSFPFTQAYFSIQALSAGQTLHAQIWSRDSGFAPPQNIGLSSALQFTLLP